MTKQRPVTLQQYAMRFGTSMGLFWIFKFILLPIGFSIPLLQLLFVLLTFFVPVLGFIYARRYRNRVCNGEISFLQAFAFCIFMYLFATLLAAMAHYIYFRFIDHGYLINTYIEQVNILKDALKKGEMFVSLEQLNEALEIISSLSPREITFQLMSQNIFYCTLLAVPTALLIMKRKKQSN